MDGKKIRLLQCKRFFKLHPWDESMLEYTKNRAATGRKRYHEPRTSALVVALPAGRGSATPSKGSTFMSRLGTNLFRRFFLLRSICLLESHKCVAHIGSVRSPRYF